MAADANRVGVKYIKESTRGTTPASPALQAARYTGAPGFGFNPRTVESNEINSDAQVSDVIKVAEDAGGAINFELSYGTYDDWIESAMRSAWVNKPVILNVTVDTEISDVLASSDTFTVASGGDSFVTGHLVRSSAFTDAGNNQLFRVVSSTSTTVVAPASPGLVDETTVPVGAKLQVVGFEGGSGELDAVSDGITSSGLDLSTLGLAVGEWIKVGGTAAGDKFVTTGLNDWARISVITSAKLTFDILPSGWTTETGTGLTVQCWIGDYLRNGTNIDPYTIEMSFNDHSPVTYAYYRGQSFGTSSFNIPSQDIITGSFSLLGTAAELTETRVSGATDVAVTTSEIMNSSADVGRIAENGTVVAGPNYITGATIAIDNSLRPQTAVGSSAPVDFGAGKFRVTGTLNTFFGNKDLVTKLLDNSTTSFDIRVIKNNQVLLFDLPRAKFTAGNPEVASADTDVFVDLGYQAYKHPTLGYTMQLQRFSEVVNTN
jgi:hypothetical protein